MEFLAKYKEDANWYDISDDVVEEGLQRPSINIPFISRNKDYSLNAQGFAFKIPATSNATIERVRIKLSNYGYEGIIRKVVYNRDSKTYEFTVESSLQLLKNKVAYELYGHLDSTDSHDVYRNPLAFARHNVGVLYAFDVMFDLCGLDSDCKTIYFDDAIQRKWVEEISGNKTSYLGINYGELKIDEQMLYAVGQNIARKYPITGTSEGWDNDLSKNFFEMLELFCQALNLDILFNPTTEKYEFKEIPQQEYYGRLNLGSPYILNDDRYEDVLELLS